MLGTLSAAKGRQAFSDQILFRGHRRPYRVSARDTCSPTISSLGWPDTVSSRTHPSGVSIIEPRGSCRAAANVGWRASARHRSTYAGQRSSELPVGKPALSEQEVPIDPEPKPTCICMCRDACRGRQPAEVSGLFGSLDLCPLFSSCLRTVLPSHAINRQGTARQVKCTWPSDAPDICTRANVIKKRWC